MTAPVLLSKRHNSVMILTMNRPDKRNALDSALGAALIDALEASDEDANVRVAVLTGAGAAFSAGADMREFRERTDDTETLSAQRSANFRRLLSMISELRLPVIAAVNGFALGGGCALAIACDMVIAADDATFGYPEIRHGLTAEGVLPALVRHVGRKTAFDLVMTGRTLTASEAKEIGLVNRVVPKAALEDEATALAGLLAGYAPDALARMKSILNAVADMPVAEGIAYVQAGKR